MKKAKKIIFVIIALMTVFCTGVRLVNAQVPAQKAFNYQTVVRDESGATLPDQAVTFRMSILVQAINGPVVYSEIHAITTDQYGSVALEIGRGTQASGDFASIAWGTTPFFLKTEIDPDGGSVFTEMGTTELLYVPLAFYADNAAKSGETSLLTDKDNDTKIDVETITDEDIIRFNVAGAERMVLQKKWLEIKSGNNGVFIGDSAGALNTSGDDNTFIGYQAGRYNTSGDMNTFIGKTAGKANVSGDYNTFTGRAAGFTNYDGSYNSFYGLKSGLNNISGSYNSFYGHYSGNYNTTGDNNSFFGNSAGISNETGNNNSFFGQKAGYTNSDGVDNSFFGRQAGYFNTSGDNNAFFGMLAGYNNTTGTNNVAIGARALRNNTVNSHLVAIGDSALMNNGLNATGGMDGLENTAIGSKSLYANTTGYSNTAVGDRALYYNITGHHNTAIGSRSLNNLNTGNCNTVIGSSLVTYIGAAFNNSTAIGYNTILNGSNMVRFGNEDVTSIGGYAGWTHVSDKRFNKNVKESVPGMAFIMKLRPVSYYLDMDALASFNRMPDSARLKDAEAIKGSILQTGFIAQEVEKTANELGFDFSGVDRPQNEKGVYGLRYEEFTIPLVKAAQEQQVMIDELKKQNEELQKQIDELKTYLKK